MENFFEPIKEIHLTSDECDAMRRRIVAYTALHTSPPRGIATWFFHAPARVLFILSLILLVGIGGFTAWARPGNVLYPVKTTLVERTGDIVTTTEDAQLEWDLTKLERRIADEEYLVESFEL